MYHVLGWPQQADDTNILLVQLKHDVIQAYWTAWEVSYEDQLLVTDRL